MKAGVVLAVILMAAIVMVERGQAAITCGQVDSFLAPCLAYLTGEAKPSRACCTGVEYLKDNTPTTADRQAACKCIKDAATRYRGIKLDKARQLPKECGVDIGVPITPDIDCSKIS
ncbi:non-specific lipid-transfer protein [Citrus sinensis]|uniref:Non-specific lipid-transfer protein n=1 Tax=Citrus sinensis TaxID=2711 RepID=A0ACB8N0M9_CITSI|nr:non-specific lipid-transfer protein [Citrus sinensis]